MPLFQVLLRTNTVRQLRLFGMLTAIVAVRFDPCDPCNRCTVLASHMGAVQSHPCFVWLTFRLLLHGTAAEAV